MNTYNVASVMKQQKDTLTVLLGSIFNAPRLAGRPVVFKWNEGESTEWKANLMVIFANQRRPLVG